MKNSLFNHFFEKGILLPILFIPLLALLLQASWNEYMETFETLYQRKELGVIINWKGIR